MLKVGLHHLILLSFFLILGCLPEVKQTQCSENEAFNATLRSCVPVIGGPESFIKIDSFFPTSVQTKYKDDDSEVELFIEVSNPYNQTYTVSWSESYYNTEEILTPTNSGMASSYSFVPSTRAHQVGPHFFMVKLKDGEGKILDIHTFEIIISETPSPYIDNISLNPPINDSSFTPLDSVTYSLVVQNNNASISENEYTLHWRLYKSGALETERSDPLENLVPTSSQEFNFEINQLPVGNYTLNARLLKNGRVTIDEKQWTLQVTHPDKSKIISRDIYKTTSLSYSTTINAFNGVPYNSFTDVNFIPHNMSEQADFCVELQSGEGTYSGDGHFISVKFFLDDQTLVYEGKTTENTKKICLGDSGNLSQVQFSNPNDLSPLTHQIVARVYDDFTGEQYTIENINDGLGGYPISWTIEVHPQNASPEISFSAEDFDCEDESLDMKNNCSIESDTEFNVSIEMKSDDFYHLPDDEDEFDYSIALYRGSSLVHLCSKDNAGVDGTTDLTGPEYGCKLKINSFDSSGPFDTSDESFKIVATLSDKGSPINSNNRTSKQLIWNFHHVSEKNTAPQITQFNVSPTAEEGDLIQFTATLNDDEKDDLTYEIRTCLDSQCESTHLWDNGLLTYSNGSYSFDKKYFLPEDFLHDIEGCDETLRNETCSVKFTLTLTDNPFTATPQSATKESLQSLITNINPAPQFLVENLSPNQDQTYHVLVGYPFSISGNPSLFIQDDSSVTSEKSFTYQWFIKRDSGDWTEIQGANSYNLNWTPSLVSDSFSSSLEIKLCVQDQSFLSVDSSSPCSSSWDIDIVNNIQKTSENEMDENTGETAVWLASPTSFNGLTSFASYQASIGADKKIHLTKSLISLSNGLSPMDTISFEALPEEAAYDVKDLSITGNDTGLYVAYLASYNSSPYSYYPQVRRIDLRSGKISPHLHQGIFGFDYDGIGIINNCTSSSECPATQASQVESISFNPSGSISGSLTLQTTRGDFEVFFGTANGTNTICNNCSGDVMASQLASLINTSTDPLLAGFYATTSGNTVYFEGSFSDDYFNGNLIPRISNHLGKIFLVNNSWRLPFIDNSLGGGHARKISLLSGASTDQIDQDSISIYDPVNSSGLGDITATTFFDNFSQNDLLWIASIKESGSQGVVYSLNANHQIEQDFEVFSGLALIKMNIQVSSNYVYVLAQTMSEIWMGIYDLNGNKELESRISDISLGDAYDFFAKDKIKDIKILAHEETAKIFVISKGLSDTYHLYVGHLKKNNSEWSLSCGDCKPLNFLESPLGENINIGLGPFMASADSTYQLSDDGSIIGQGIKDFTLLGLGQLDDTSTIKPYSGLFNIEGENIISTTISGEDSSEDTGLFRSPFVKNE